MEGSYIREEISSHAWRTEIPNIVFDLGLDPHEFRLYCEYKRIAGDHGKCFRNNQSLADSCNMSLRKLQYTKKALSEPRKELAGNSLIKIQRRTLTEGNSTTDEVIITDLWTINFRKYLENYDKTPSSQTPKNPKNEEKKEVKGGCTKCTGGVYEMHGGGVRHAPKEEQCKKNNIKKDNVKTMPSFTKAENAEIKNDPMRFVNSLTTEQRKIHDELIAYKPMWGDPLNSKDVCAWFLAKKWSIEQIKTGFEVYKQDAQEAFEKGRIIASMGGSMVKAIQTFRKPKINDMAFNKAHAAQTAKRYAWMTVLERYVKVASGVVREEIELNQPKLQFLNQLESCIRKAEIYA